MDTDRPHPPGTHRAVLDALTREARHAGPAEDEPGITEAVMDLRDGETAENGSARRRYELGLALVGVGRVDEGVEVIADALESPKQRKARRRRTEPAKAAEASPRARATPALRRSSETGAGKTKAPKAKAPKAKAPKAKAQAKSKKRPAKKTPARKTKARKRPAKKTPARKTPARKAKPRRSSTKSRRRT